MRVAIRLIALLLCAIPVHAALAQVSLGQPVTDGTGILTLDQNRLYTGSRYGQRMLADIDRQVKALQQENRKLEADLEAEEKSLTERRASLPPEEFRALASAFDEKVTGIRNAREAKARELQMRQDEAQKTFLQAAVPILAEILSERNAEAIIDRQAIILLSERIDITDLAIQRIDAELLKDGTPAPATPEAPAAPQAPAAP